MSTTLGNGSRKLKNSKAGMTRVGKVNVIRRSCLANEPDIQGQTPLSHAACYASKAVVKYYADGKVSIPTGQMISAGHRSPMPLGKEMREW